MAKGKETPTGEKEQQGRGGGDRGSTVGLFKRETEHLYSRDRRRGEQERESARARERECV